MQIRVLGPIEVVVEEHARSLPGAGERELLALLALAAGRVVAVPALIDALWDGPLPANPGNALQVRVSKLRRALTAAGLADTLLTRPAGYLLDVDPSSVDALRFAHLVAAARTAAAPEPETAARRYREALGLWRGTPLAEFAGTRWAGPEAARLTELHLAARVELIDLELAAGRHTEMLTELEGLIAAHPLHEPTRSPPTSGLGPCSMPSWASPRGRSCGACRRGSCSSARTWRPRNEARPAELRRRRPGSRCGTDCRRGSRRSWAATSTYGASESCWRPRGWSPSPVPAGSARPVSP